MKGGSEGGRGVSGGGGNRLGRECKDDRGRVELGNMDMVAGYK